MGDFLKKLNPLAEKQFKKKSKKKKTRRQHSKAFNTFLTVILSLAIIAIISVTSVAVYVLHDIVSFANGEVAIDLNEYMLNQARPPFFTAMTKAVKRLKSQGSTAMRTASGYPLTKCPKA